MCGSDGTGGPSWCTSMPWSNRAAASSSPETSCDEAEASSVTAPPRTAPDPWMVNGSAPRPPSSIDTPSSRRAESSAPIGRSRARGSPSNATEAGESAVSAGRNRMVVPELPTSTLTDEPGVNGAARDGEVRSILFERATEDPERGDGKGCVAGLQHPPQHREASR